MGKNTHKFPLHHKTILSIFIPKIPIHEHKLVWNDIQLYYISLWMLSNCKLLQHFRGISTWTLFLTLNSCIYFTGKINVEINVQHFPSNENSKLMKFFENGKMLDFFSVRMQRSFSFLCSPLFHYPLTNTISICFCFHASAWWILRFHQWKTLNVNKWL